MNSNTRKRLKKQRKIREQAQRQLDEQFKHRRVSQKPILVQGRGDTFGSIVIHP